MNGRSQRVSALNSWISRTIKGFGRKRDDLPYLKLQLMLSNLVIAFTFAILLATEAGHLGANPLQRSALLLAGLVYGGIGTPHVLAFLLRASNESNRTWLRIACSVLAIILLYGSTIAGSTWMAFILPSGTPWHSRAVLVAGSVALVVAGWREAIANVPSPETRE
jgi:hypothetical protein